MPHLRQRVGFFAKSTTKLCLMAGGVWLGGLVWFYGHLQSGPVGAALHTDGIVVLTGGQNRLETGIDLLATGAADRLLVSGVHPDTTLEDLQKRLGRDISALTGRIDLGRSALDTAGNAGEAAAWAAARGIASLRVVTANYHMPRAMVEFRRAMPGMALAPNPVLPFSRDTFAARPLALGFIVLEYHKYLFALARARLAGELSGDIRLNGDLGAAGKPLSDGFWLEI